MTFFANDISSSHFFSSLLKSINLFSFKDIKLKKLCIALGTSDWNIISSNFPFRTEVQCQQRWEKVLNPNLVKGAWTKEVCFYWLTLWIIQSILWVYLFLIPYPKHLLELQHSFSGIPTISIHYAPNL